MSNYELLNPFKPIGTGNFVCPYCNGDIWSSQTTTDDFIYSDEGKIIDGSSFDEIMYSCGECGRVLDQFIRHVNDGLLLVL